MGTPRGAKGATSYEMELIMVLAGQVPNTMQNAEPGYGKP